MDNVFIERLWAVAQVRGRSISRATPMAAKARGIAGVSGTLVCGVGLAAITL